MQFTDEQIAIFDWLDYGDGNLVIRARAGAGKTTTLVELCRRIKGKASKTFVAFNKHIQEEIKTKVPPEVFVYTSHGLGFGAIKRKYPDIEVDEHKADKVIARLSKSWDMSQVVNFQEYLDNMKQMVHLIRLTLTGDIPRVLALAERYEIRFGGEDASRSFMVLENMLNDKTTIDFTDMVYWPSADKKLFLFPQDYVLIDEAQDLSKAHHELIKKTIKWDKTTKLPKTRLIFCGDDLQSIYAFAGADQMSFENLTRMKNTVVLPLTISFRCAKAIIAEANKVVTDIRALPDAPEGVVRTGSVLDEAEDGDFVLARKSLPLVRLFFQFLLEKKKATIKGADIGANLIHMVDGHASLAQLGASLTNSLAKFREKLLSSGVLNPNENSGFIALQDNINVIRFLSKTVGTVADLKAIIASIFKDKVTDGIILSTIHKAKGLEANRVFIVRPDEIPMRVGQAWMYQQELNLKYIAITRAKLELIYDEEWTEVDAELMIENATGSTKTENTTTEPVLFGG